MTQSPDRLDSPTAPDPATEIGAVDVVVLGAGSGGYACALRAAQLGLRVVLVERDLVGGTCLHRGCIPTKAILHAAEVADAVREADTFGVQATLTGVDPAALRRYSDSVVSRLHQGLTGLIAARNIEVVAGHGRLARDGDRVGVDVALTDGGERRIEAHHVVLASGSYAKTLPGIEIDGRRVITSDHAIALDTLPGSAIVLGGGVIGVEFASAWRSFGVEVTIVEALPRLVPNEDPQLSTALERAFRKRKFTLRTGAPVDAVRVTDDGVVVQVGGDELTADLLLVAVGRGPATDDLGYAEAGVTLDRGFVATDARYAPRSPGCTPSATSCPGCSWPTAGSHTGSSWPRRSRTRPVATTWHRYRSTTSTSRG